MDASVLIAAARSAREFAIAPFSHFQVGAALLGKSGRIYSGCNIENASFGLTLCAERTAIFKALSEGERQFQAIAIFTAASKLTPPCGACRQILWEFCGDLPVILANLDGRTKIESAARLLPRPFGRQSL